MVYIVDGSEIPVFDLGDCSISVRLSYALVKEEYSSELYAVYVDSKGKVEWLTKSSYNTDLGAVIFETGHFSIYGIGYKGSVPIFTDIKNHWTEDNIIFMANRGLLAGIGNNQFSPKQGMFAIALGQLTGIKPTSYQTGKFIDVKVDAYFHLYVN